VTPRLFVDADFVKKGHEVVSAVRPLRIAMLSIHSNPLGELGTEDTGGMSVYIRELSQELGRAGHRVDIYTCAKDGMNGTEQFLSENVRLIHLGLRNNRHVTKSTLVEHLPEVFRSFEGFIQSNPVFYDIIHSHYWISAWVGRLAQERWYVPHVMMFHTTGIAKRIACSQEREPSIRLITEKKLAHACDRIFAPTVREKDLLARYYSVPGEKIGIVPCGVNLERFRPVTRELARRELGLQDIQSLVLYVGRFAPVKGIQRLLAAAGHLRSYQGLRFMIIGGDGPQAHTFAELSRFARRASVEGMVRFQGRVEHNLLPLYYSAADVLVLPSYYESFGLVALESLACGTPVIATRVGAMDTLIQDGRTGFLLDTPSPYSLALTIKKCIMDSSNGSLSREDIRNHVLSYGWSNIASNVVEEYSTALQSCIGKE
jgi:D-inositol-3-phosphate glycosyltransferase